MSESRGLKFKLFHGRNTIGEEMHDHGFKGPVLEGVLYMHGTYGCDFTLGFESEEATIKAQKQTGWRKFDHTLAVRVVGDLIETEEVTDLGVVPIRVVKQYYGDWEINFLKEGV